MAIYQKIWVNGPNTSYWVLTMNIKLITILTLSLNLAAFDIRTVPAVQEKSSKLAILNMSRHVGKPKKCLGENKGADQLRSNREADQRLCFRNTNSTMPHLLKSEISSFQLSSVAAQAGLCQTWSEPQIVGFLTHRLRWWDSKHRKK